jgi:polyisoprenyl-teichoic acid--peptidoglycan teichoic acid transferase
VNFTKKRIRKRSVLPKRKRLPTKTKLAMIGAVIGLIILFMIVEGIGSIFANYDFGGITKKALLNISSGLTSDSFGNVNILLAGTGGEEHDGGTLTDTIIVAAINPSKKTATMLSIPRDFYVNTRFGGMRINNIVDYVTTQTESEQEGFNVLLQATEEITNLEIPYYIKIDFQGFTEAVDALGGVPIFVEETINDPYYPKDGTIGYSPFYLAAGEHMLDGKTALKYARSRKTTSDFDRARRQQKLIFAMKQRALSTAVLTSPTKLKNLYTSFQDNVSTNMSIREMIALAEKGSELERENIVRYVLNDDFTQSGGFLYPPLREHYGGAFVLLPAGDNFEHLHRFTELIFRNPEILQQQSGIQILNGAGTNLLAGNAKMLLRKYGFNVSRFGNARARDIEKTTYYYRTETEPASIKLLRKLIPGEVQKTIPQEYLNAPYAGNAEIVIELGKDAIPVIDTLDVFSGIVIYYGPTTTEETEAEEGSAAEADTTSTE